MAYFRENDPEETRLQPPVRNSKEAQYDTQEYVESDYDDGFDDPEEPEDVPELTEEEKNAIRKKRFRVMSDGGDHRVCGYPDSSCASDEYGQFCPE